MANKQAAGGNKVSVEDFEQREQRGRENDADNPAGTDGLLEGNGRHEWFRRQLVPRRDVSDGGNHDDVEDETNDDGAPRSRENIRENEIRDSLPRRPW